MAKISVRATGAIDILRCTFAVMAMTLAFAVQAAEAKVLVVNEIQVTDAEKYKEYVAQVPATPPPYGGVFIVRGGNGLVLSGSELAGRIVIAEFPSRAKAMEGHESVDYQRILKIRNAS